MDLENRDERSFQVVGLGFFGIERLDREGSTGNGKDGALPKKRREFTGVECCRGTNES